METVLTYVGLFWIALIASTIFPAQSEPILLGLLLTESYTWWTLVLVATIGNVLGSAINWFIGKNIARLEQSKWFPIKRSSVKKAEDWYQKYGKWSLLLSWVPFVGDPLTLAAGVLRERFVVFIALVFIAKFARYLAIAALAFGLY